MVYGGCGGGGNLWITLEECEARCGEGKTESRVVFPEEGLEVVQEELVSGSSRRWRVHSAHRAYASKLLRESGAGNTNHL